MEDIAKTQHMKFKPLIVINSDYEAMLEEIYDLKIKGIEQKVAADEKQEDIDVWDQETQSKTHVYEKIIETL